MGTRVCANINAVQLFGMLYSVIVTVSPLDIRAEMRRSGNTQFERRIYSRLYNSNTITRWRASAHNRDAAVFTRHVDRELSMWRSEHCHVAPSIADLCAIDEQALDLDGVSIFES